MAREYAITNNRPVIVEAMSYRVGHHSTSDDSSAYRETSEITRWTTEESPIQKLKAYMESKAWWNGEMETNWIAETKKTIMDTMKDAEKKSKPDWRELFHDVYYDMPDHIR